jgi:hypothetical protein
MNTSTASRPTSRVMLPIHNQVGTFTGVGPPAA